MPISTVELSGDGWSCVIRENEIWTPVVLENPGFEACPPDLTANGVRVFPIILIYYQAREWLVVLSATGTGRHTTVAVSSTLPTSTTQTGTWVDVSYQ